jgi:hypothetical protein
MLRPAAAWAVLDCTSKNRMISRQGSHLKVLGDARVFDISFEQFGQSGFIAACSEIV